MRDPDLKGALPRECPALVWLRAAEGMMAGFESMGIQLRSAEEAGVPGLPTTEEDLTVRAWEVNLTPEMLAAHEKDFGHPAAGIAEWLVNGPFNPFWKWWYISTVHLRDVEGIPTANKHYPEAEYELAIYSLDPEPKAGRPEEPDIDLIEAGDSLHGRAGFLSPPDLVKQFHGVTDHQAKEITRLVVETIITGKASPDSDFRSWWEHTLDETVRHLRQGLHE